MSWEEADSYQEEMVGMRMRHSLTSPLVSGLDPSHCQSQLQYWEEQEQASVQQSPSVNEDDLSC